jgi:hypothetical protein
MRAQWDDEHDNRCSCGERESLEHVVLGDVDWHM